MAESQVRKETKKDWNLTTATSLQGPWTNTRTLVTKYLIIRTDRNPAQVRKQVFTTQNGQTKLRALHTVHGQLYNVFTRIRTQTYGLAKEAFPRLWTALMNILISITYSYLEQTCTACSRVISFGIHAGNFQQCALKPQCAAACALQ